MPNKRVQNLTEALPYSLKEAVNGYVDAVSAAIPDIAKSAGVDISGDKFEKFLLIVAIRRIWSTVNSQYWTMNDCIQLAAREGDDITDQMPLRGFRVGRDEISAGSDAFRESQDLRQDFQNIMAELEITNLIVESVNLSDLARGMFLRDGDGRS